MWQSRHDLVGSQLLYLTYLASARSTPRSEGPGLDRWGSSPATGAKPWGWIQLVPSPSWPAALVCLHRAQAQAVLTQRNPCPFWDLALLFFLSTWNETLLACASAQLRTLPSEC